MQRMAQIKPGRLARQEPRCRAVRIDREGARPGRRGSERSAPNCKRGNEGWVGGRGEEMDTIAVLVEEAECLLELANLLLAELVRHGNGGDERNGKVMRAAR